MIIITSPDQVKVARPKGNAYTVSNGPPLHRRQIPTMPKADAILAPGDHTFDWDSFPPCVKRKVCTPIHSSATRQTGRGGTGPEKDWREGALGDNRGASSLKRRDGIATQTRSLRSIRFGSPHKNPEILANGRSLHSVEQCFSSLERLRLAQAASIRPKSSSAKSAHALVKNPGVSAVSPKPTLLRRNSSYFRNSTFLRSRKATSPTSDTFSPSDAQWFQRLPDKVRQKHFTQEERLFLSGRPETIIPDAADERVLQSFYQQGRETNRSLPTLSPSSSSSSVSSRSFFDADFSGDSSEEMDDSAFDGFRWIENDDDHDLASTLRLDDYHEFMNEAADLSPKLTKRQPSFRRTLSLSSLPFVHNNFSAHKPTNTSPVTPVNFSSESPAPASTHFRRPSFSQFKPKASLHSKNSSVITVLPKCAPEPPAIHYTDPSARLKLRVYLASPQKFDEAIEFGFPSMDDKEVLALSRPSLNRYHPTAPSQTTFLYDDPGPPSVFDALDDDDDDTYDNIEDDSSLTPPSDDEGEYAQSLPDRSSPYTPLDALFPDTYLLSPSLAPSSSDRTPTATHSPDAFNTPSTVPTLPLSTSMSTSDLFPRPTIRHNYEADDPYIQALSGLGREMTIRMTLTRADLRSAGPNGVVRPGKHIAVPIPAGDDKGRKLGAEGETGKVLETDPLALDHLPLGGGSGPADLWDSVMLPKAQNTGVLRRVWRKVSGRSCTA